MTLQNIKTLSRQKNGYKLDGAYLNRTPQHCYKGDSMASFFDAIKMSNAQAKPPWLLCRSIPILCPWQSYKVL
jgi:hypothetical protein